MLTLPLVTPQVVAALREAQFPIVRNTVYLNHASISPLARRTVDAMNAATERLMLAPSQDFPWFLTKIDEFNEAFRALINAASADEICGVQSTSLGFNLVAQSMQWQAGQTIVLCDTEFPSNVYPWMRLAEQHGVETRFVPTIDGGLTVEALAPFVDASTRMVCASAVQFFSGHRSDLQALGDFCHERGILFVVDAIQAAGHVPIDVQAMHIDILCAGGQKSLMGPAGQGFLYVRRELVEQMRPTMVGPNAVDDYLHWLQYKLTPLAGAARFTMGTMNLTGIVGLLESVKLLREIGLARIDTHVTGLAAWLREQLIESGYHVVTPANQHAGIITFRAAETEAATTELVNQLAARNIILAKHWDKHNETFVRASLHCYNTHSDLEHLLTGLKEISG